MSISSASCLFPPYLFVYLFIIRDPARGCITDFGCSGGFACLLETTVEYNLREVITKGRS